VLQAVTSVNVANSTVTVHLAGLAPMQAGESEEAVPDKDLNPIFPEAKEIFWGFGSFIVFAVLLRYWLYPRLRKGMDARYYSIREGHESAEKVTDDAREAVAQYEAQLAGIRAEAQQRIEAARATLDAERSEKLGAAGTRIAEKRAAAATEAEQARAAAQADVESAVRSVVTRFGELATGRTPDAAVVSEAVSGAMSTGVSR
jgi:F-type H+-transporting ATPase subunit b